MYNVCKHIYFLNNLFTFIFKAGYRALNVYFNIIYSIIKVCFMLTIVCTVNTPDSSFWEMWCLNKSDLIWFDYVCGRICRSVSTNDSDHDTCSWGIAREGEMLHGNIMMLFMRDCQRGKCCTVTYDARSRGIAREGEMLHGNIMMLFMRYCQRGGNVAQYHMMPFTRDCQRGGNVARYHMMPFTRDCQRGGNVAR